MKLPIQARPMMRMTSTAVASRGVTPQACGPWLGTSPYCEGNCDQCAPGQYCETDTYGDGEGCATGSKVRCCNR